MLFGFRFWEWHDWNKRTRLRWDGKNKTFYFNDILMCYYYQSKSKIDSSAIAAKKKGKEERRTTWKQEKKKKNISKFNCNLMTKFAIYVCFIWCIAYNVFYLSDAIFDQFINLRRFSHEILRFMVKMLWWTMQNIHFTIFLLELLIHLLS